MARYIRNYEVVSELGSGHFGAVFTAVGEVPGRGLSAGKRRLVAIKKLKDGADRHSRELLRQEFALLDQVKHRCIVRVYEFIEDENAVVMEHIHGVTLRQMLDACASAREQVFTEAAIEMICELADGLYQAYTTPGDNGEALQLVHRDLKPENIMLEQRSGADHVVILDFGIAAVLDEDVRISRDGQVMGTPGYIAPEQALGNPVDGRADQYSLAAVVYQLLCGRIPHQGTSGLELMTAQLTVAPNPFLPGDEVPAATEAVLMRALSRAPADRHPSLRAFATALRASLADPSPAEADPTRRGPWLPIIAAALVTCLTACALLWMVWNTPAAQNDADAPPSAAAAPRSVESVALAAPLSVRATASVLATARASSTLSAASTTPASPPSPAPETAAPISAAPISVVSVTAAPTSVARRVKRPPTVRRKAPATRQPRRARPKIIAPTSEPPAPASTAPRSKAQVASTPPPTPISAAPVSAAPVSTAPVAARAAPMSAPPTRLAERPKGPGRLAIGAPIVSGAVSDRPVRAALLRTYGRLRRCVEALDTRPAGARATIHFVIDSDGFFGDFRGGGHAALAACGLTAVRRARRLGRRPDTGRIEVRLPLRLEAP